MTSKDLIYRQQAIEALGEEPEVWTDSDAEIAERNQWRMDVAAIKAVPSAQPERKKGRWKLLNNGDAICSECGRKQKCVWDFDNRDNFCRHCGTDMRGEQDESFNCL